MSAVKFLFRDFKENIFLRFPYETFLAALKS